VPDSEVASCPLCAAAFGLFVRRHHCRRCGGVFCGSCSGSQIALPLFGMDGTHRVCDGCHAASLAESRLVMAATRSGQPDEARAALALVREVSAAAPAGRLAYCTSERGEPLLMLAAFAGGHSVCAAILATSPTEAEALTMAQCRDPAEGRAALHAAAESGHDHVCRAILDRFKEPSRVAALLEATDRYGLTALTLATKRGHTECCTILSR